MGVHELQASRDYGSIFCIETDATSMVMSPVEYGGLVVGLMENRDEDSVMKKTQIRAHFGQT